MNSGASALRETAPTASSKELAAVNSPNHDGDGQNVAKELQYAPLPADLHTKAQAKVDGLQCNGAAITGT